MSVFNLNISNYLADLPDLVTPEILASKLGIKVKTVYQRHWRQHQQDNRLKPMQLMSLLARLLTTQLHLNSYRWRQYKILAQVSLI